MARPTDRQYVGFEVSPETKQMLAGLRFQRDCGYRELFEPAVEQLCEEYREFARCFLEGEPTEKAQP